MFPKEAMLPIQFQSKIESVFIPHANPQEAESMSKYMKNKFSFLGIKMPVRKELTSSLMKEVKQIITEEWLTQTVRLLWQKHEREYQYVAIELIRRFASKYWRESSFEEVEKCITGKSWWDSVDAFSTYAVAPLVLNYPALKNKMKAYCNDDNLWLRRVAIIYQLPYYEKTDRHFLWEVCLKNASDNEFLYERP
jgi:3-methyladenine DNA glycosylase AlkD